MDRLFSSNSGKHESYQEVMEEEDSNSDTSLQSWISWFCSLSGHEFYLEVPEDFIEDEFNLTGLSAIVPFYNEALEMILDIEPEEISENGDDEDEEDQTEEEEEEEEEEEVEEEEDDGFWKETPLTKQNSSSKNNRGGGSWVDPNIIEPYAAMLYGLIHQRYLLTRNGLRAMAERYVNEQFGVCPRYYCYRCPVIPCGRYDESGHESVRLYCPSCRDLYTPPNPIFQNVDGSHFGTTYAHLMFETFADLTLKPKRHIYQPRIFGFRVNETSRSGPRMQWLRMRPDEYTDLEKDDSEAEDIKDKPVTVDGKKEDEQLTTLTDQVEGWRMKDSGFNSILRRFF